MIVPNRFQCIRLLWLMFNVDVLKVLGSLRMSGQGTFQAPLKFRVHNHKFGSSTRQ